MQKLYLILPLSKLCVLGLLEDKSIHMHVKCALAFTEING